jgi:DNA-3-methyladenine glycosylase II
MPPVSNDPSMKPVYWEEAIHFLGRQDAIMARLVAEYPGIHMARRGDPFTTLARAIVGQQISVRAAQAIWDRLVIAVDGSGDPTQLEPGRVGRTRMTTLRRVGLSENKALYIRDLARHFVSGALDPSEWRELGDEDLIVRLTSVKGIGRWTAEIFLMFHELRPDVLPVADIGLQNAVALHYHGGTRVPVAKLREFAAMWSPWRSVATWYLWRSLDPIPVEY